MNIFIKWKQSQKKQIYLHLDNIDNWEIQLAKIHAAERWQILYDVSKIRLANRSNLLAKLQEQQLYREISFIKKTKINTAQFKYRFITIRFITVYLQIEDIS